MTLRDGLEFVRRIEKELCIFNAAPEDPIDERLETLFETQNLRITTTRTSSGQPPVAVLSDQDGVLETVSLSTLRAVADHNPGRTNALGVADAGYDRLLAHLKETTFTSYDTEQMLYASREIEDRARRVGSGTIHAGFQRMSVLHGQRSVYGDLPKQGVTVHAYGVPDAPSPDFGSGHVHAVGSDELATTWFVIFDGGDTPSQKSGLIAEERAENEFYGAWTYDAEIVDRLCGYLDRTYLSGTHTTNSSRS